MHNRHHHSYQHSSGLVNTIAYLYSPAELGVAFQDVDVNVLDGARGVHGRVISRIFVPTPDLERVPFPYRCSGPEHNARGFIAAVAGAFKRGVPLGGTTGSKTTLACVCVCVFFLWYSFDDPVCIRMFFACLCLCDYAIACGIH